MNDTNTSVRALPGVFAPSTGLMLVMGGKLAEAGFDEALRRTGLSLAKMWGLRQLAEADGPLSLRELAGRMGCAKSNASALMDRLQAQGLVRRLPDPEDGRGVLVGLTAGGVSGYDAGLRLAAEAESHLESHLLGALDHAERRTLARLLAKLGEEGDQGG